MSDINKAEQLIEAWVKLTGMVKNSRITQGLMYNEATVMLILYKKYREDGVGMVSVKEIVEKTNMLKSLVTRTLGNLESKGLLEKCDGLDGSDKRVKYVKCVESRLKIFLKVHSMSLELAESISAIIGPEDTDAFIRIVNKIENAEI